MRVFDSKLELAAYRWLAEHGVKFETQVEVELQPRFVFEGKKIRKISYFADFKILGDFEPPNPRENPEKILGKTGRKFLRKRRALDGPNPREKLDGNLGENSLEFCGWT